MHHQTIDLIGAALGWGAQLHETEQGVQALKQFGLIAALQQKHGHIDWRAHLVAQTPFVTGKSLNYGERLKEVAVFTEHLANEVKASLREHHFPVVIGGDHAIAIGTWNGAVAALEAPGEMGLIWFDAHMDSHTPQTTPSQAIHGMPLAVLLGKGEPSLVNLLSPGAKLNPAHVVLIGVRSFEPGEAKLLKELGVKIYYMADVQKLGLLKVVEQAVVQVTTGTKAFGVSVDLDAFDPTKAPGVGSPSPEGILPESFYPILSYLRKQPTWCALEIAEFNPSRDIQHQTAKVIQNILLNLI